VATAVVWKMNADKSLEPVQIKLGITDHTTTEVAQVMKGSLNPKDQLVTGAATALRPQVQPRPLPVLRGGWRRRRKVR